MSVKRKIVIPVGLLSAILAAALGFVWLGRSGRREPPPAPSVDLTARIEAPDARVTDAGLLVEGGHRFVVRTWSFALDRFELRIEDAKMSAALDTVLTATDSDFVVNGGFFDPAGRPVGLAMSGGDTLSRLDAGLSGGVLVSDDERAQLFASEGFSLPVGSRFAIQCRPRLVVAGAANVSRDDGQRAERTALCTRDAGRTIDVVIVRGSDDGVSAGPSLFAFARHLVDARCESALNLDGGPSTGAAWREGEEVKILAPRGPVRHVVAFRER